MKFSARNVLEGKVKEIKEGPVNVEVVVELTGGQEVVSVITKASSDNLALAKGKKVYTIMKASSIIVAVD
ncbi:molybdopterin-binding protein [Seleniivibrio woodruffii]|uniref:TOBE domain-containing protein n=1 Tax=Seleniivibrio woodruffii TaxID=1078050 RepID=UPI0026EBDCE2|nr:TOBE domain-containing protein [Seleniivibrio woodruffii]